PLLLGRRAGANPAAAFGIGRQVVLVARMAAADDVIAVGLAVLETLTRGTLRNPNPLALLLFPVAGVGRGIQPPRPFRATYLLPLNAGNHPGSLRCPSKGDFQLRRKCGMLHLTGLSGWSGRERSRLPVGSVPSINYIYIITSSCIGCSPLEIERLLSVC